MPLPLAAPPPRPAPACPAPACPAPADEELAIRAAARAAEDQGDLDGARRLLRLLGDEDVPRWLASLEVGLRCRDDAARARWLLQPAFRHGFVSAGRQTLLTLAADVLRSRGQPAVSTSPETARAVLADPLLVDAGLFELQMLADYVTGVLQPAGHPLAPLVARWPRCRASVFEVVAPHAVHDALEPHRAAVDVDGPPLEVGRLVYGRVLPLPDGHGFALPPVPVDRLTSRRIARAVLRAAPVAERLRAVASSQRRAAQP